MFIYKYCLILVLLELLPDFSLAHPHDKRSATTTSLAATTASSVHNAVSATKTVAPAGTSVTQKGCVWVVPGTGSFTHHALYDFTSLDTLPKDLYASDYEETSSPYNLQYLQSNVIVGGGALNLLVPGGQTPESTKDKVVDCGEIQTTENKILYGSVRTKAMMSTVPGTCQSSFFYATDRQEIDIEYISDPTSNSNPGTSTPPWLQFTNQPGGSSTSFATAAAPLDVTQLHEYRIDWIPGKTMFFTDGVLQKTLTGHVPSKPGAWVWNNWSDGNQEFTVGPPSQDSVYQIQSIEMYYNVSGNAGSCAGNKVAMENVVKHRGPKD